MPPVRGGLLRGWAARAAARGGGGIEPAVVFSLDDRSRGRDSNQAQNSIPGDTLLSQCL